ncbi:MAG: substrate-binding domain-containing protein [Actinomycetota bacterium]|nr:substrate-binding domain-containing protein [Actinomycetota bacterium]
MVRARRILTEADEALADAGRAARGESGSLRVSTAAPPASSRSPASCAPCQARPQVQLDLRQISWEDHSGGLLDGSVDAAFVWLPFAQEGLAFAPLHEEPRVAALEAVATAAVRCCDRPPPRAGPPPATGAASP